MLVVTVVGGWLYANRRSITIGAPGASELLQDVIAHAGLRPISATAVDYIEQDGTTPDTAMQTYTLAGSPLSIKKSVERSCRALRLDAPDRLLMMSDPSTVCDGRWREQSATILLTVVCSKRCEATVTAEVLG